MSDKLMERIEKVRTKPRSGEFRATHGTWKEPALAVEKLVAKGYSISEGVRIVARELGFPQTASFHGLRGAYYTLRRARELGLA